MVCDIGVYVQIFSHGYIKIMFWETEVMGDSEQRILKRHVFGV